MRARRNTANAVTLPTRARYIAPLPVTHWITAAKATDRHRKHGMAGDKTADAVVR